MKTTNTRGLPKINLAVSAWIVERHSTLEVAWQRGTGQHALVSFSTERLATLIQTPWLFVIIAKMLYLHLFHRHSNHELGLHLHLSSMSTLELRM